MAMEDQTHSEEYGRPRRPSADTVSYLNSLPLDESQAAQQAKEYLAGNGQESPPMLSAAHAALSSIYHEVASLSCEETPSQQIETLVRICCRYSLVAKRVVLASLGTYWVFLSTHRFGSHVAQTVLRCAIAECEVNLDDFDDGGGERSEGKLVIEDSYGQLLGGNGSGGNEAPVPHSLFDILLQSVKELNGFADELVVHLCGSHVLRTALCILAGAEFVEAFARPDSHTNNQNSPSSEWETGVLAHARRGKLKDKKKKKKKKKGSTPEGSGSLHQEATVTRPIKMTVELQSEDFQKKANALLEEIVNGVSFSHGKNCGKVQPPGELQQRACHPSAGPLLVQILRLLSFRDGQSPKLSKMNKEKEIEPDRRLGILPREPTYRHGSQAESFVHSLLCWDPAISNDADADGEGESSKQPYASDIIYGLSGEPRGSILLETIFRCCPDSFHDALCNAGGFYDEATLREYIQHGVSNFVVQTLLVSVRNKEQASRMVKCLCGIVDDGSMLKAKSIQIGKEHEADDNTVKLNQRRMGIIWRAFEMCATKGSSQDQEKVLSALLRGFASATTPSIDGNVEVEHDTEKKRRKRSKTKGLTAKECIPLLLGLAPGSCEGEADGTRLTLDAAGARALYHVLHFKERLRSDWVKSIVNVFACEDLVSIANDGLGSRCVMDGLLDGPSRSTASKLLTSKISDRFLYLATERVGHHTVEKVFRALPSFEDKASLSAELSQSLNRLGSNAMGRSVMATCAVKEYLEGESAWKSALAKREDKSNWIEEITGKKEERYDDEENEEFNIEKKKDKKKKKGTKRKRKNDSSK